MRSPYVQYGGSGAYVVTCQHSALAGELCAAERGVAVGAARIAGRPHRVAQVDVRQVRPAGPVGCGPAVWHRRRSARHE